MKYNEYLMLKEDDDILKKGSKWIFNKAKNKILSGREKRKMERYMHKVVDIVFKGNSRGVLYNLVLRRLIHLNKTYKKYEGVFKMIQDAREHFNKLADKYKIMYDTAVENYTESKDAGAKEEARQHLLSMKDDIILSFEREREFIKKSLVKVVEDFDRVLLSIIDNKEVLKHYPKKQDHLRIIWRGIYTDIINKIEELYNEFKLSDEYKAAYKIYLLAKTEVENILVSDSDIMLTIRPKKDSINANGGSIISVQLTSYGRHASLMKKSLLTASDPTFLDNIEDIHDIQGSNIEDHPFSGKLFAQGWTTIVLGRGKEFYAMGYVLTKRGAFIKSNIVKINGTTGDIDEI